MKLKPHGTGRYRQGCRCNKCVTAQRQYLAQARARRLAGPIPGHVHGTWNGYTNYGCRCSRCTDAMRAHYPRHALWRAKNRERLRESRKDYYRESGR